MHSAYDMFSWYKYLTVNLVFSHLDFCSGNLFMIAPFLDRCLLVPFHIFILRKLGITVYAPFLLYESGVLGSIYYMDIWGTEA